MHIRWSNPSIHQLNNPVTALRETRVMGHNQKRGAFVPIEPKFSISPCPAGDGWRI
jgi:hypothetical protein